MKQWTYLALIMIVGLIFRLWRIETIPPSLSHDEVAIAYNAYSILKTGNDEYGRRFPVLFRSFDDYKLPGMVYSTIPFVALFGKNEIAARLPSALYGILAILVMFGLSTELLGGKRWLNYRNIKLDAALLPTLMMAISPWHINFSRQLFESNGAVFWFMLGTYYLLKSRKKYTMILWAGICFIISLYFYYSVRLVIPCIGILYVGFYWKTIFKHWKISLFTILICLLLLLPLGRAMISKEGLERISIVSVIHDPLYIHRRDAYIQKMGTHPTLLQTILFNRRIALLHTILDNYRKNISLHHLFVTGTGTYGNLYPFEALLIPFGILYIFTLSPFGTGLLCIWAITAFLPGALSINQPNSLRTLLAAPVFALFSGFGMYSILLHIHKSKIALLCFLFISSITVPLAFAKFYYAYFIDNPTNNALAFADGSKQMIEYVYLHEANYSKIYITGYYWRPYIFFLYWGNADPLEYQKTGSRDEFRKYSFTSAGWDTSGINLMDPTFKIDSLPHDATTLFILSSQEYELHSRYFNKISEINGRVISRVYRAAILK